MKKIVVIKMGGSLLNENQAFENIAEQIATLKKDGFLPVVVHGGGSEISDWQKKLGIEPEFIDGLRKTDQATMEIAEMLLCGKVQNIIIDLLNKKGLQAVGLSGKDALLFEMKKADPVNGQDLGFVGEVTKVNPEIIETLTKSDYVPVIACLGGDLKGNTYNINGDTTAGNIAAALNAEELLLLTNVGGILKDDQIIGSLNLEEAKNLLQDEAISGGMIPKLKSCIFALENGVKRTQIIGGMEQDSLLNAVKDQLKNRTVISQL